MHPKFILACLAIVSLVTACTKKEISPPHHTPGEKASYPPGTYNPVVVKFHLMFGNDSMKYGKTYVTESDDSITISKFKFLITRITTIHQDSSRDFLFRATVDGASPTFSFFIGLGPKKIVKLSFTLGVDSETVTDNPLLSNYNGFRDMYWGLDSGYTNLKLEGELKNGSAKKPLIYHIGGYRALYRTERIFTFDFQTPAITGLELRPVIHLVADVREIFRTPNLIDINTTDKCLGPGVDAFKFAENYSDMIRFDHIDP